MLRRTFALPLLIVLAACSGAGDGTDAASDAVTGANAPWTTEAQVADTANYEKTVLAYLEQRAERGKFISDHPKQHATRQGNDVEIAYAVVHAAPERGAVVVVNGRTESFSHYGELVYDLSRRGYSLYLLDHRGQGHSSRLLDYETVGDAEYQKGYVDDFHDYVDDLAKFVDTVVVPDRQGRVPGLFAIAHSMGGAVMTRYAEEHPHTFDAIALSSPMHQIKESGFKLTLAAAIDVLFPTAYGIGQKPRDDDEPFAGNELTSSEPRFYAKRAVWNADPETKIGGVTYRWITESVSADKQMLNDAALVQDPILLLSAGADQIVDDDGHHKMCDAINGATSEEPRCQLEVIDGAQHEQLIEVDAIRQRSLGLIVNFFAKHAAR